MVVLDLKVPLQTSLKFILFYFNTWKEESVWFLWQWDSKKKGCLQLPDILSSYFFFFFFWVWSSQLKSLLPGFLFSKKEMAMFDCPTGTLVMQYYSSLLGLKDSCNWDVLVSLCKARFLSIRTYSRTTLNFVLHVYLQQVGNPFIQAVLNDLKCPPT